MTATKEFFLHVHVPADEWAYVNRRATYLEAVLVQVLHDQDKVSEWYDAAELARMRLPGMPTSKAAITRRARAGNWRRRETKAIGGTRLQYHFASLPPRAFDALIAMILHIEPPSQETIEPPSASEIAALGAPAAPIGGDNTAPAWVLPFMRLLKGGAHGDLGAAWRALPKHLPAGTELPSQEEAARVIARFGLAKG